MDYAKLIDGAIVYGPCKLAVGESVVYNPTPEMLTEAGYKPVVYTDPPVVAEGFVAVPGWEETADEIVQTWTVEQVPISEEEALIRYSNELTGASDESLVETTETLIKIVKEEK